MKSSILQHGVERATNKWTKQRKKENRGQGGSRRDALTRTRRVTFKDAAWQCMPDAYRKASGGGTLPTSARQMLYAARPYILERTGKDALDSRYFTQTILPQYMAVHHYDTADWDITYDARGHCEEPHTELITPLGTLDVRHHLSEVERHVVEPLAVKAFRDMRAFPTLGPHNRFCAVLFIEKEGFMPLLQHAKLAERYDIALMTTKGMPVVACRYLADELCGRYKIPLLVMHDFDQAGFSILGTLGYNRCSPAAQSATGDYDWRTDINDDSYWGKDAATESFSRYEYVNRFEVIDMGLRLEDVHAYGLVSEAVRPRRNDPTENLQANGATPEEIEFLCDQRLRVELNAFSSDDFLTWLEGKLQRLEITKVVPDAATLSIAAPRALQVELVRQQLSGLIERAGQEAGKFAIPKRLEQTIRKRLAKNPELSWDQVLADWAAEFVKSHATGSLDSAS